MGVSLLLKAHFAALYVCTIASEKRVVCVRLERQYRVAYFLFDWYKDTVYLSSFVPSNFASLFAPGCGKLLCPTK